MSLSLSMSLSRSMPNEKAFAKLSRKVLNVPPINQTSIKRRYAQPSSNFPIRAGTNGSYSRSRYELENKCVIHSGCVVVWSLVELFVEFDCCVNCSRVAWLVVATV